MEKLVLINVVMVNSWLMVSAKNAMNIWPIAIIAHQLMNVHYVITVKNLKIIKIIKN